MIIDISGVILTPGNGGNDCLGNGEHTDKNGKKIECCCDECDYALCCVETIGLTSCDDCCDENCPRAKNKRII